MIKTNKRNLLLTLGIVLAVLFGVLGGMLFSQNNQAKTNADVGVVVKADEPTIVQSGDGWSLNSDGVLYIAKSQAETSDKPWSSYASNIYEVVIDNTATSIPKYLLQGLTSIQKVTGPVCNVQAFSGAYANYKHFAFLFGSGTSLDTIYIGSEWNNTGRMPESLTEVVVTMADTVPEGFFSKCRFLTSISFDTTPSVIKYNAFGGCSALLNQNNLYEGIYYTSSDFKIAFDIVSANMTEIVLHENTKFVYSRTFQEVENITSIRYSQTTDIYTFVDGHFTLLTDDIEDAWRFSFGFEDTPWSSVFYLIQSVDFGESVSSIENYSFKNCPHLTEVNIPNNIKSIGECAFSDCENLARVTLGTGLNEVGSDAFYASTETVLHIYINALRNDFKNNYASKYFDVIAELDKGADNADANSIDRIIYDYDGAQNMVNQLSTSTPEVIVAEYIADIFDVSSHAQIEALAAAFQSENVLQVVAWLDNAGVATQLVRESILNFAAQIAGSVAHYEAPPKGGLEYVIGDGYTYDEAYDFDGLFTRPVQLHYDETLSSEFDEVFENAPQETFVLDDDYEVQNSGSNSDSHVTPARGTTWVFNDEEDFAEADQLVALSFTSNGITFEGIDALNGQVRYILDLDNYDDENPADDGVINILAYDNENGGWQDNAYKTIIISENATVMAGEDDVTDSFFEWLGEVAEAQQTLTPATGVAVEIAVPTIMIALVIVATAFVATKKEQY